MADKKSVIYEQLDLMAEKLLEEGRKMPKESLVIDYNNGGGQAGIRENPYYQAYEKLLASFLKTLDAAESISGAGEGETLKLDALRSKIKVTA